MKQLTRESGEVLVQAARQFFIAHGTLKLLGREMAFIFSGHLPGTRFDALLEACGYPRDPLGFIQAILDCIQDRDGIQERSAHGARESIRINGILLPVLFLVSLLEILYPQNRLLTVKTLDRLKDLTNLHPQDSAQEALQQVMDLYPVRLSDHVIRQSRVSQAVAAQYLPFAEELDPRGHDLTFDGHFKTGVLEQMYQNRVIFLLGMDCPVYCRFCFRKHKGLRREKSPGVPEVKMAVDQVGHLPAVQEVLITGGEPLVNRKNLEAAMEGLMEIDHVQTLRIATRSIAYYPQLFLKNHREYLGYLKSQQAACRKKGKRLEVGVHFVHPDEVSLQSLDIIKDLVSSGIPVYVQTPFLNTVNNSGPVLARLFTLLRNAGAQIYYIFTPCHPIHGTQTYWTPISEAIEAYQYLRAHLSDRCIPKLCTATPLGKMEWQSSGWAVAEDASDPDHVWIRTPYTRDYFKAIAGQERFSHPIQENPDGTLNVRCLMDVGDKSLLRGNHCLPGQNPGQPVLQQPGPMEIKAAQEIRERLLGGAFFLSSLVTTPCRSIIRVHKTRVEMTLSSGTPALDYVRENPEITDVVLHVSPGRTIARQIERISALVKTLGALDHIACVRLRWKAFQDSPEKFTLDMVQQMVGLARFCIADPLRIEMETWWTLAREIRPDHGRLIQALADHGVHTYANLPLISNINDDPNMMAEMARALRGAGMVFHHVVVAGLAVQDIFNGTKPIHADQVMAIASHVRRVCSGREIPLYMIQTALGEVDFGLTSCLVQQEGSQAWLLRLDPFDLDYFLAMDPGFTLEQKGAWDKEGTLVVPITGLTGNFSV